jgi:transposase
MVASAVRVAKYGWRLPLYRQAKMLVSQSIDLERSTLVFWVGYAAAESMPLWGGDSKSTGTNFCSTPVGFRARRAS